MMMMIPLPMPKVLTRVVLAESETSYGTSAGDDVVLQS